MLGRLSLSKTQVDNNIRFSNSIVCIKNKLIINNYRTEHCHIRPQCDHEQGINKLQSIFNANSFSRFLTIENTFCFFSN